MAWSTNFPQGIVLRVLITGLGCVSGLGLGVEPFWSGLVAGTSGVRPLDWPSVQCPRKCLSALEYGAMSRGICSRLIGFRCLTDSASSLCWPQGRLSPTRAS